VSALRRAALIATWNTESAAGAAGKLLKFEVRRPRMREERVI